MTPIPLTKIAPPSPPKLPRPSGILKTTKPKAKTAAAAITIKAATIKTIKTTTSTATTAATDVMLDTLIERLESFGAEPIPAQRMLESLVDESAIDDRIEMAENEMLRYELKERQKQLRWAIQRSMYLERKYEVGNKDRSYRYRSVKKGRAAKIIAAKMGAGGDEEKEEKEEEEWEPEYKMPGSWVD